MRIVARLGERRELLRPLYQTRTNDQADVRIAFRLALLNE
jgi:hypothetical protein